MSGARTSIRALRKNECTIRWVRRGTYTIIDPRSTRSSQILFDSIKLDFGHKVCAVCSSLFVVKPAKVLFIRLGGLSMSESRSVPEGIGSQVLDGD